jgi:hypothetical protein
MDNLQYANESIVRDHGNTEQGGELELKCISDALVVSIVFVNVVYNQRFSVSSDPAGNAYGATHAHPLEFFTAATLNNSKNQFVALLVQQQQRTSGGIHYVDGCGQNLVQKRIQIQFRGKRPGHFLDHFQRNNVALGVLQLCFQVRYSGPQFVCVLGGV